MFVTLSNVAITPFAASRVTAQSLVPLHAPLHPTKVEVESADALNVTIVPES